MRSKVFSILLVAAWLAPLSLGTTGCPSSGGNSGTPGATATELSAKTNLTDDDKLHFLRRTHFAFAPADLQQVNSLGYSAYLDWMLTPAANPGLEAAATAATVADPDYPGTAELSRWWLYLMVNNPNPFQELLAIFWHDHFAASTTVLPAEALWWGFNHINLWRYQGTSDLRTLLHAMAIDWLMLEWLDGVRSTAGAPNENFGREFWELFTLGVYGGYTQADIVQSSRCFTGFRTVLVPNRAGAGRDQLVVQFAAGRHDNGTKNIFGINVPGNGQGEYMDMVNLTVNYRPVAEFICRKIWEAFVYLNPSPSLLTQLATSLRDSNYDLKQLFKLIFSSEAFFSVTAKNGLVKSPIEHVVGFMRTTGLKITETRADNNLINIGQRPTQPPTVNGWPSGEFWLSSQALLERANMLRDAIQYKAEAPQVGFDVGTLVNPGQTSDVEVVDRFGWLLRVTLTTAQRQECLDYLNQDRTGAGTVIAQPWDFNDAVQKDKKLRGLLYILGQHPTYAIR